MLLLLMAAAVPADEPDATSGRRAWLLDIKGAIGPAVSDFVGRGIEHAQDQGAQLVILRIDTPGGLDSAMRDIIKSILSASVPVVTYVAPSGARAASAGTYILYASHVAAMAPATNLGAATPVQISPGSLPGGGKQPGEKDKEKGADEANGKPGATAMERKIINDAVAYIRGLAELRGRNADWAEKAVRDAASLNANDALDANVIDIVAEDLADLVGQLDGFQLEVMGQARTLETEGLLVETLEPDWRNRLLTVITNPNVAYILMLLGIYGLFFELYNPGSIVPGVIGAICLLLALYAFQVLPVNYAGFALILIGIAFMVGEAFMPSFGALGIGGAIAFVVGSLILMETDVEGFQVSVGLILMFTVMSGGLFLVVMSMALQQRHRPVVSGQEEMVGIVGEVIDAFDGEGHIRVHGELWRARTSRPVAAGDSVRVRKIDGLTLVIEPTEKES